MRSNAQKRFVCREGQYNIEHSVLHHIKFPFTKQSGSASQTNTFFAHIFLLKLKHVLL